MVFETVATDEKEGEVRGQRAQTASVTTEGGVNKQTNQQLVWTRPLAGLPVDTHCRSAGPADVLNEINPALGWSNFSTVYFWPSER